MNVKLYATSAIDIALIAFSLLAELDPMLRSTGLLIGAVVGLITALKMWQDFRIKQTEKKMKSLDLKKKEEEIRRFFEEKYRDD